MRLEEYLSKEGKTQAAFAREIDETPQNVNRYVNGERIPEEPAMTKIFEATAGQVDANDFYNLPAKPNSTRKKNGARQ